MLKFIIALLIPIFSYANPNWLFNINGSNSSQIIGYGVNSSLSEAKQNAISDIAQSLSVTIDSSVDISTSDDNGDLSKHFSTNLKTNSKAILSGIEFIKVEKLDNIWYVAAKYDNSPLEIKLKKVLPKNLTDEKQNSYLKNSPLFVSLMDEINKKLDYKIVRKDNLWQLNYKDILLPLNQNEFYKLFFTKESEKISIKADKQNYKENDEIHFNVEQCENSYVSILYVEHNGKVGVLLPNYRSKNSFIYPAASAEERFKIANPYKKPIQELYVAVCSQDKISLNDFENVSEDLLDESNYNFDKLIAKLDKLQYSTFVIKIKK